jgi:hypothetical protein
MAACYAPITETASAQEQFGALAALLQTSHARRAGHKPAD